MSVGESENPPLSRRLKRALMATLLAVLVLATLAAAISAYLEASDVQDEMLLSVARLVESNQVLAQPDPESKGKHHLEEGAVRVWAVGGAKHNEISLSEKLKSGFHTIRRKDDFWRTYVTRANDTGARYAVAQQLSVSAELAFRSAVNTAIPLLLLFLMVPLLVTFLVRHGFKPLHSLTTQVGRSDSLTLKLDDKKDIPLEVVPFVTAIESLLEKNQAYTVRQRRFIADAAHELRTPITALSLEVENVQSASSEAIRSERQAKLSMSVSRLQRLVNQLLDLARAQSIVEQEPESVSLDGLVRAQVAQVYLLAEDKGVELSADRMESVHTFDINEQLQHLIRNALSNAIKFAPDNGQVEISVFQEKQQAVFCVTDNGPGVSEEHLGKLHQPFYRPSGQVSGDGAGLGLAICHEIASRLNGKMEFENLHPTGFRFCYRQPIA